MSRELKEHISSLLEQSRKRREKDAERWKNINWDICQVCGKEGPDRRTLFISCFYDMSEVSPKFMDLFLTDQKEKGWALRICKGCRATLMFDFLRTFIETKGRLACKNLDDQGIMSFDSKEQLEEYRKANKV